MTLARWQATITDEAGNVLPSASITVRREAAGSPLASLFSDRAGATPIGNPFTAEADGYAAFHVAGGAYRITASLGGVTREWRYVAVGLAAETDASNPGVSFTYDAGVNDEDPGAGAFAFNNNTPGLATKLFISQSTPEGLDVTAWLSTLNGQGKIIIQGTGGSALLVAAVTGAVVDDGDYFDVPISVLAATDAGTFVQDARFGVLFSMNGADGVTGGIPFTFSSTTAMADPGAGTIRLNNATLSSVTAAAVDDTSAASGNPDVSAWVLSWDDSTQSANRGVLILKRANAPQNFAIYTVSGASTDNAGWTQLALTYVDHAGSFSNGDVLTAEFSRTANAEASGRQTIWVPASAMTPRFTNGAAIGTIDSGSNDLTLPCLDFDQTTAEHAHFNIAMPKQWNEGTVTFQPFWTAGAGSAAQTCIFTLAGVAISNDDVLNASFGTAQSSSDALIATGDLHVGPESSAITIGGSPADGDLCVFQVSRDIADTLAADARLLGIKLYFTADAGTDA